jgi:uncharacterized damage-inducible protein DinB
MFRRIEDFVAEWRTERDSTLKLLHNLTDESLPQQVVAGGRTLGFLAWHITVTLSEMPVKAGLAPAGPAEFEPAPARAADIAAAYESASASLLDEVTSKWNDGMLEEKVDMYGDQWTRGMVLEALIRHEAHHRGQMTVLMRQAGLPVAGVYGPSREEWAQWGMEAHP